MLCNQIHQIENSNEDVFQSALVSLDRKLIAIELILNYRPVSLHCQISKIYTKKTVRRLENFI